MGVTRAATAQWEGPLLTGSGTVTFDSSLATDPLDVTWPARVENPGGITSPEELIAAAHATCYSMSLAHVLATAGSPADHLKTTAEVFIDKDPKGGHAIQSVTITVRGKVPGIDEQGFVSAAEGAKTGCPVSKALAGNVAITLDAALA